MSLSPEIDEVLLESGNSIDDEIKNRWMRIEQMDNVFRYKLNVEKQKILPGTYQFFVEVRYNIIYRQFKFIISAFQLNAHRTTLRRKPQIITSIVPIFNENEFNFNKINHKEILFNVRLKQRTATVTFLINNSPLTKYHTLLVPRLQENLPQLLTRESMSFVIQLLHNLNDKRFRIGYNSPGALASVNHLHLHLLYIEQRLFIEDVVKW